MHRNSAEHFTNLRHFFENKTNYETGAIVAPILWRRKFRLRRLKWLTESHIVREEQSGP
jgi:hypothetical protein